MELTIKSRKLNKDVTFFKNNYAKELCYIFVDLNGKKGTLGKQICKGGYLQGGAITSTDQDFEKICKRWLNQYYTNYFSDFRVGIRI